MIQRIEHCGDRIVTIRGLVSSEECDALIRAAEGIGFDAAPVTTSRGFEMMPELRNNTRVMLDDRPRADALFGRLSSLVPSRPRYDVVGLNERFRFYRYEPGEYFHWHYDGAFHRNEREQSLLTAMVYLNGGFEGGATEFQVPGHATIEIVPEGGIVLLFDHGIRHRGAPVKAGRKYVLRTDVMYRLRRLGETEPTGSS